ncbi:MAG: hypothetical protein JNK15_08540 [Planctomycetes bacterium]|nr:hypothetical protein [Planctomycetota bacterium]
MNQIPLLLQALRDAGFPHPVAIRPARDAELGSILEADALDVPESAVLATHEVLADLLWPHAFAPCTVLAGVFDSDESAEVRASLPAQTVLYEPPPSRHSARH